MARRYVFTLLQRSLLIDHLDGPVPVTTHGPFVVQTRASLLAMKLLTGHPHGARRPRSTILTEAGRQTLGQILGECGDALVRAGLLEQERPLDVLRRLRARAPAVPELPAADDAAITPAPRPLR